MQPNRINVQKNNSKKTSSIIEEDEVLKDGVEIDWIKDKASLSL